MSDNEIISNIPISCLSLELSVLEALLKRNRYAHGRTLYYQRTSMVLQAIQKYEILELESCMKTWMDEHQLRQTNMKKNKNTINSDREKVKDERWVLKKSNDHTKIISNTNEEEEKEEERRMQQEEQQHQLLLEQLQHNIITGIPEILSRIQHASSAYLCEISRGFFLPLCTVALASLARIRIVLMIMGRQSLLHLQTIASSSSLQPPSFQLSQDLIDRTMTMFVEDTTIDQRSNEKSNALLRQRRDQIQMYLGIPSEMTGSSKKQRKSFLLSEDTQFVDIDNGNNDEDNIAHDDGTLTLKGSRYIKNNDHDYTEFDTIVQQNHNNNFDDDNDDDVGENVDFASCSSRPMNIAATNGNDTVTIETTAMTTYASSCNTTNTTTTSDLLQQVQSSKRSKKSRAKKEQKTNTATTASLAGRNKRKIIATDKDEQSDQEEDTKQYAKTKEEKTKKQKKKKKKRKKDLLASSSRKKDIFDEIFGD